MRLYDSPSQELWSPLLRLPEKLRPWLENDSTEETEYALATFIEKHFCQLFWTYASGHPFAQLLKDTCWIGAKRGELSSLLALGVVGNEYPSSYRLVL
jgi:hypothetical protein